MTDEQLLFQVASASNAAQSLAAGLWNSRTIDREKILRLNDEARRLSCAATELERRSAGVMPPKRGD